MVNDLLTAAIRAANLDQHQLADVAGVDPKTVERWISGRVPHPRHRAVIVREVGVEEAQLWPDTARVRGRSGMEEITGAWARRDERDVPDWRALMRAAEDRVDLIGYSLLSVLEARGATAALAAKAADGVPVRVAIADPDSPHAQAADRLQRPAGRVIARVQSARERLRQLASEPGVEVREHRLPTSHTILRFDDQLLLTIHLAGTPGFQAPLLHLHRERDYGIFDQLTKHVEDVWQNSHAIAAPSGAAGTKPEASATTSSTGADAILDQLDKVWRPGT